MGDMAGAAKAVLCMTDSVEVYGPCTCRLKEYGTFTNTFTIVRGCVQSFLGILSGKLRGELGCHRGVFGLPQEPPNSEFRCKVLILKQVEPEKLQHLNSFHGSAKCRGLDILHSGWTF